MNLISPALKVFSPPKYSAFPARYFGPEGETRVFDKLEDVPEGWADRPGGEPVVKAKPKAAKKSDSKVKWEPADYAANP